MTDTGQVPGEGLPESAGTVEQPGVSAPGAYAYLSETTAEDEDLLLLPGAQSAWGNEVAPPPPEPVVEAVHEPGPHEMSGRDSGSVDLSAVRLPNPAPPSAPVPPRRPLHLGPPIPDASASPVRSLADRGPAGAPLRHPGPPTTGPEYLDVPPQAATPWGAQAVAQAQVSAGATPAETVVPAAEPPAEPVGAAQAVVTRVATQAVGATAPQQAYAAEAGAAVAPDAGDGEAAGAAQAGVPVAPGAGDGVAVEGVADARAAEAAAAGPAAVAESGQVVGAGADGASAAGPVVEGAGEVAGGTDEGAGAVAEGADAAGPVAQDAGQVTEGALADGPVEDGAAQATAVAVPENESAAHGGAVADGAEAPEGAPGADSGQVPQGAAAAEGGQVAADAEGGGQAPGEAAAADAVHGSGAAAAADAGHGETAQAPEAGQAPEPVHASAEGAGDAVPETAQGLAGTAAETMHAPAAAAAENPHITEGATREAPHITEGATREAPHITEGATREAPHITEGAAPEAPHITEGAAPEAPHAAEAAAPEAPHAAEAAALEAPDAAGAAPEAQHAAEGAALGHAPAAGADVPEADVAESDVPEAVVSETAQASEQGVTGAAPAPEVLAPQAAQVPEAAAPAPETAAQGAVAPASEATAAGTAPAPEATAAGAAGSAPEPAAPEAVVPAAEPVPGVAAPSPEPTAPGVTASEGAATAATTAEAAAPAPEAPAPAPETATSAPDVPAQHTPDTTPFPAAAGTAAPQQPADSAAAPAADNPLAASTEPLPHAADAAHAAQNDATDRVAPDHVAPDHATQDQGTQPTPAGQPLPDAQPVPDPQPFQTPHSDQGPQQMPTSATTPPPAATVTPVPDADPQLAHPPQPEQDAQPVGAAAADVQQAPPADAPVSGPTADAEAAQPLAAAAQPQPPADPAATALTPEPADHAPTPPTEAAPTGPDGTTAVPPSSIPPGHQQDQPLGQFVPVEGSVPTTPHLAPTPPHALTLPPEGQMAAVPAPREAEPAPAPATPDTEPDPDVVQNAEDLDTRAADQEESKAAVEETRESTGPAAPAYDDAEREAVLKVMRERRDIRNGFRSDPIPHEVLLRVLEAAHTAPSVGHSQPWDFVVIRSAETRNTMHELAMRQREAYAKSLPKGRAKQFKELKIEAILDTPVNIVVTADPTRGGRHTLGRHTQPQMAPYSSALAVENLWLAARAEGLGVGWVSFFDEREMVRALGLPDHLEVVAYLCVGYVDEFPDEPELLQAGWSKRRPLSWVVHEETYGRRALPGEEPHDLLAETVAQIRPLDAKALGEAWERQKRMTKPAGALGMLEIISAQLSGLSRQCPPPIPEPAAVAIFAGDHGVHAQGVTPWPQEVTAQMVANFLGGGAVCNAFATQVGAEVCVVDVGVAADLPATPGLLPRKVRAGTSDMTTGPAMTREEAKQAIEVGIETARDLVAAGNKALLTGEMGIANTTASAALISVFTGADPAEVTGRGTGINDETLARKTEVVRRALDVHQPDPADPIGVLSAIGGFEHAAMVGLLLGGASLRTPVILDGVSAGAAALVARAIAPEVLAACIAGHRSAEPGHVAALNKLGLRPLVDLDLRLGEGTGALLALPLVQSTARAMHEVATFDSAGVTEK